MPESEVGCEGKVPESDAGSATAGQKTAGCPASYRIHEALTSPLVFHDHQHEDGECRNA